MLRHSRFGMVNELVPAPRQLTANIVLTRRSPLCSPGAGPPTRGLSARADRQLASDGLGRQVGSSRWRGVVARLDRVPDPASRSTPSKRSISCRPVGEVTLISVSQSPITSMPTKIRPLLAAAPGRSPRRSRGRAWSASPSRRGRRHAGWRARRLGRRHPVDRARRLAVDQDDPLVALADLREVALHHQRLAQVRARTARAGCSDSSSSGRRWNTPAPPLP